MVIGVEVDEWEGIVGDEGLEEEDEGGVEVVFWGYGCRICERCYKEVCC